MVAAGAGRDAAGEGVTADTLFDLASLTKPFTASLALILDRGGVLRLGEALGEIWTTAGPELAGRTCEELLRHRAGLRAWAPLYHRCSAPGSTVDLLVSGELVDAAPGTYSDLGYALWGLTAEQVTGCSLSELFRVHLVDRLDGPLRPGPDSGTAVESRLSNDRERQLARAQGLEVGVRERPGPAATQDGNAHFLGGLAGHAGLFGSAAALAALGCEWLGPGRWLDPGAVAQALGGDGGYALGWARREIFRDWGERLEPGAFGHVGFTGGAVWVEPQAHRIAVLLASRDSDRVDMSPWRRRLQEISAQR